jgi:DNA-binding transcriptional LysR family regulator
VLGDGDAAISAAVCGLGYVQAPSLSVRRHIDAGLLRPVLSDWEDDASLPIYVVYPKHRQPSVKIRTFTEFLKTIFAKDMGIREQTPCVRRKQVALRTRDGNLYCVKNLGNANA